MKARGSPTAMRLSLEPDQWGSRSAARREPSWLRSLRHAGRGRENRRQSLLAPDDWAILRCPAAGCVPDVPADRGGFSCQIAAAKSPENESGGRRVEKPKWYARKQC